jgi:hypothetical protein
MVYFVCGKEHVLCVLESEGGHVDVCGDGGGMSMVIWRLDPLKYIFECIRKFCAEFQKEKVYDCQYYG